MSLVSAFLRCLLKPAAFNAPLSRCWSCGDILTAEVSSSSEATAASASRIQVSLFSDVSSHLATSSNTPGDLECQIEAFVDHYNHQRYHNILSNVTPDDVYFGRNKTILREREKIKKQTIRPRRLQHQKQAA